MTFAILITAAAAIQQMPAFMAGCWDLSDGSNWTQECWMEPKAGLMLGASREGDGDKLKSWEQLRIERAANGDLTYLASPGGAAPTIFTATSVTPTIVEFTNPAHDYPQRVRYELKGDRLEAEISLIDGSKPVRWAYIRQER